MKRYEFVSYFPQWQGFYFDKHLFGHELIYDWALGLGFFEIRKWHTGV